MRTEISKIKSEMLGRIALDEEALVALWANTASLEGHHLEIGGLFGGTAIIVAMAKKQMKTKGKVYTIDPLNGYYEHGLDPVTGLAVNLHNMEENLNRFGLSDRVKIIQAKSIPMPQAVRSVKFSSLLIDGEHRDAGPWDDFDKYQDKVSDVIFFDNVEPKYGAVKTALNKALGLPEWELKGMAGAMAIVRRVQ